MQAAANIRTASLGPLRGSPSVTVPSARSVRTPYERRLQPFDENDSVVHQPACSDSGPSPLDPRICPGPCPVLRGRTFKGLWPGRYTWSCCQGVDGGQLPVKRIARLRLTILGIKDKGDVHVQANQTRVHRVHGLGGGLRVNTCCCVCRPSTDWSERSHPSGGRRHPCQG